jgi:uncharacterized coiled-coil protein SlyX
MKMKQDYINEEINDLKSSLTEINEAIGEHMMQIECLNQRLYAVLEVLQRLENE